MATETGIITALIGTATATAVNGAVRNLQVGDNVFPNEVITTGLAGAIEIEFPDGSVMDLGRNSQAVLDSDAFEFDVAEVDTPPAADVVDDIDAIQQALLAGEDPTEVADPTAAGPGAQPTSEGGSEAVVVDYLAPRITPDSGFDTTGPGIAFPDPPAFEFLVDESGDLDPIDQDPIIPPPVDNERPVADPVLTSYEFAEQSELNLPPGSFVFKQFSVDGFVDNSEGSDNPIVYENEATLGGVDNETGLADLDFSLTGEPPTFGTLYKMISGEWVVLSVGDNFNADDIIFWSATEEQWQDALSPAHSYGGAGTNASAWDGVELIAMRLDGSLGEIAFDKDGIGVAGGTIVPGQLEHRGVASEKIIMKFANNSTEAEISVSRLIANENEVGKVQAYLNGALVGAWTFTTTPGAAPSIDDGKLIDFSLGKENLTINSGNATFTLPSDVVFDELVFTGTEYANNKPNPVDSSDYYIQSVSVKEIPDTEFEYTTTDEAGNISPPVSVVITAGDDIPDPTTPNIIQDGRGNNELIGTDQDDVIIGGAGNDILTGGDGADLFVWQAGDEFNLSNISAQDTVTDFNIEQGDVLDFADILVGEESGDLADYIHIEDNGVDTVIELKPEGAGGDVKQTITLQGTTLADMGLGGFDTSTQQAEIINKLVQDGHVNVDS
ncbi:retention module-containing protein [Methylophaga nitratireducenticrescens]|uniref:Hemagglutinin/hemolysin-like protein n=1 Tax=Methylophaga nitratireducenticrescens TaxID=754476 RepID=I1XLE5_METNJ|nr:retention module-containing protein [Methylophaga nitratireducenticrescens]AFI85214.1 type I secretion C-terminal target domain-containing protein [Methylophaga nitratireducenticrescens]AUZ85698.1 type I secretion C-terminal target domain-containing protein [Methylophaga nitratireducenticrescens]